MRYLIASLCPLFVATLLGCGKTDNLPATVPASGVVTLDGAPVEGAAVTFIADTGNYHATAISDASGNFKLKAFPEKDGAVPGSYKVEVNKTVIAGGGEAGAGGESKPMNVQFGVPKKYATITTSGLKQTIPESGTTDLKLELVSK